MKTIRWTSHDLELLPNDESKRYEIVDGELYVSKQPRWEHQLVCSNILALLKQWNTQTHLGIANFAPGLIFTEDDDVAPDVVWISQERLRTALGEDGKLHTSSEIVIEVLSPGSINERRDREMKLKLYSRRGADEYWIIDWREKRIEVYQRENAALTLTKTLKENDVLQSPLLPGFSCKVSELFTNV
jgi:Uma2 family endonuclease